MDKGTQLPETQIAIMKIIWENGGTMMFAELYEALQARHKSWKANTVLTLLSRLVARGMLEVRKHGRLNEYVARMDEQAYQEQQAKSLVDEVFGGDAKHLISALVRQEYLSQEDYTALQDFWNWGGGQ